MLAMAACVKQLNSVEDGLPCPDFVLVDGNRLPSDMPETKARSVVKVMSHFASCYIKIVPVMEMV